MESLSYKNIIAGFYYYSLTNTQVIIGSSSKMKFTHDFQLSICKCYFATFLAPSHHWAPVKLGAILIIKQRSRLEYGPRAPHHVRWSNSTPHSPFFTSIKPQAQWSGCTECCASTTAAAARRTYSMCGQYQQISASVIDWCKIPRSLAAHSFVAPSINAAQGEC